MDEELNVELETENLFDDYEPTSEESTETVEEPTEESSETPEVAETPWELDVKFNGEERILGKDEARILAQKGMNYDRFYEPLERLARANNMSVGDYMKQLESTQSQYELEQEMENLRNDPKYENVSDEVLEEIAQNRVKDFNGQREQYFQEQTQKQNDLEQQRVQREVDMFLEEYPEFKDKDPNTLDPKVYDFVRQGYTLLEAYNKFQRLNTAKSQAESKAKVNELNETNKRKALGNTTNAGSSQEDAFLSGFLNS
jgi:hypothetical protein